ncbi:MAG: ERCC4 domain-containing protein [Anaerolineae bacterium]|nr:ERCC4 domain-containing protein [Anaerolineae bacterium]
MTTPSKQHLLREKLLLRYTGALERGDAATVAAVLRHAETDPDLARMIDEINAVYAAEDSAMSQIAYRPSANGHQTKESSVTTLTAPAITQRSSPRRNLPLTLVATLTALLLIGSALFSAFNRRDQGTPAALQATATTTITSAATPTADKLPIRYYLETLSDIYIDAGIQHEHRDGYQYLWVEAPNKFRLESYANTEAGQYEGRLTDLARSTTPDFSQFALNKSAPFNLVGIAAGNGNDAWSYMSTNPVPSWVDPHQPVVDAIGLHHLTYASLDDLLNDLRTTHDQVKRLEDESVLDRPVYVIEGIPTRYAGSFPRDAARTVLKVDQATLAILSFSAVDADNNNLFSTQAIKFMPEPTLDPALFSFALPAQTPVTVLPDWFAENLRAIWASRANKADFDMYGLLDRAGFTQKNLVPGEFYLDPFGRTSLQYYHTTTALFDTPALAIWVGSSSAAYYINNLPGQWEPTQVTSFLRKVDVHGVSATLGEIGHFPLIHQPLTAMIKDPRGFYRLFWTINDTVIVLTADKTKLTEQGVVDIASMLTYVPPMLTSDALSAGWQTVADQNRSAPSVFKPSLFDDNVIDSVQADSRYNAHIPAAIQSDTEAVSAARSAIDKLIPELPTWRDGGVVQRYRSAQHPGVVLVISQGGSWIVPTEVSPSNRDEAFDYHGFKGIYRVELITLMERANPQPENMQTVITQIEETTIVMQAPLDALSKEELLAILPSLQKVLPTSAKQ